MAYGEWCPTCGSPIIAVTRGIPSMGTCSNKHTTDRRDVLRRAPTEETKDATIARLTAKLAEAERDALIGAAYEAVADHMSEGCCGMIISAKICALTPAEATAALATVRAEARKAGMLAAAGIARSIGSPVGAGDGYGTRTVGTSMDAADAILAAAEKGPST